MKRPSQTIVGRIPVLECLRARRRPAHALFVLPGARGIEAILEAAAALPLRETPKKELDRLAGGVLHQGVVLSAEPLPQWRLDAWLAERRPAVPLVVVLDGVEDPHNFGAIVRSAAACGASAVLFGKDRAAPVSPASVKAAAGAMEYVDLIQEPNIARSVHILQKAGLWVSALDARGDKLIWEADLEGGSAIVVGGEGAGVRPVVAKACDFRVRIPLDGPITSLNASVSASAALIECLRQRRRR